MDRLNDALNLVGITEKTPSHVIHNLLTNILAVAILNSDGELETACESMMKSIQQANED